MEVYFDGNFWDHEKTGKPGAELAVEKEFIWYGEHWKIPAVYICEKGLVVDFCVEIPRERMQAFTEYMKKFHEQEEFSDEKLEELEAESPLHIQLRPSACANGEKLPGAGSCSVGWNPCEGEEAAADAAVRTLLDCYDCDNSEGWVFIRHSFSWPGKVQTQIESLSVTMEQEPVRIPGPHFTGEEPVKFRHPVTGEEYTLTVLGYEPQVLEEDNFPDREWEWPRYYRQMTYSLRPALPEDKFSVLDCLKSGQPRRRKNTCLGPTGERAGLEHDASEMAAIGIIGGAGGPTAVFMAGRLEENESFSGKKAAGKANEKLYHAWSSPQFEPAGRTEWRIVFHEKLREDLTVEIL